MNVRADHLSMITRVLIANRGEIALRVIRTCRDLGIGTVAVFSDADADAPFVRAADTAVALPGNTLAETYLNAELIVAAAQRAGADALHPGYGFLSENAAFARAVETAGLTWIGPPPSAIEAMGSKVAAKKLMAAADVPVLGELSPDEVSDEDLPVLVKASAGGGGRGMRVVTERARLADEIELARAEALAAFGDDTVFCERYLAAGRHIEVQVLADGHGTVWAAGERECSIQRRHQKVIEEAPSPLVQRTDGMRERLFAAATAAARAVDYVGAGTIEFIADETGHFYFLEMNTRLQVEHPVTECTTGLDLVALQLHVAAGGRLDPEPPPHIGHAVEARLYAEDPRADWQPQTGVVHHFAVPAKRIEFATDPAPVGVRVDSSVVDGSRVGIHYDAMLAKVIGWAPDRATAARTLAAALAGARLHGVGTNRDLLVRILRHPAFLAGDTDTAFFETHRLATLAAPLADAAAVELSAIAAALALDIAARAESPVLQGIPPGWRNVVSQPLHRAFDRGDDTVDVHYRLAGARLTVEGHDDLDLVDATATAVVLAIDDVQHRFVIARYDDLVAVDSALGPVQLRLVPRFTDPASQVAAGSLLAPMPGSVVRVAVSAGDHVAAGDPVLWLEAMKMQHRIDAPVAGVVTELSAAVGHQVESGTVLAVVTPHEEN